MKPVIELKKISKKYPIQRIQQYYSLRESIMNFVKNPLTSFSQRDKTKQFWALKNISFNVMPGEVVGIIGKNGAGKSTLLKILSQITSPTDGEAILRGRVASLLEVGTGFHPELTGRENIYLNGAILGMTRVEINAKFKNIVSFSEIGKFLDTPVKHYSSGMYMRLAFSIAAHLDPEILIVDEVLAVGDASFQKKSLGRMKDVSKKGRTVIFVSHNMHAVISLCQKVYLLEKGRIVKEGRPEDVVSHYLRVDMGILPKITLSGNKAAKNEVVRILNISAIDSKGKVHQSFDIRKPIGIQIEYSVLKPRIYFACNIQLTNDGGLLLFNSPEDNNPSPKKAPQKSGIYKSTCWIPGNFLAEGVFLVRVSIGGFEDKKYSEVDLSSIITFRVHDTLRGNSVRGSSAAFFPGVIRPILKWTRS